MPVKDLAWRDYTIYECFSNYFGSGSAIDFLEHDVVQRIKDSVYGSQKLSANKVEDDEGCADILGQFVTGHCAYSRYKV